LKKINHKDSIWKYSEKSSEIIELKAYLSLDGRGVERVMEKNKNITIIARNLRKRSTDAERLLWKYLSSKKMEGLKFRRQQPIGKYIVDFVCFEKRILIEVDGGQHAREVNKDIKRDECLRKQGFRVLRFWNNEVLNNMSGVWEVIRENCL